MNESTAWWLLAGVAVALELVTGTFYLLMMTVGLVTGAIAAHLGFSQVWQIAAAAVVGAGAVVVCYWRRKKGQGTLSAPINREFSMDIGETVHVTQWNEDGTTNVKFRGANWTAIASNTSEPAGTGKFRIKDMQGNRLVIEKS